jgi:hypothetical protein
MYIRKIIFSENQTENGSPGNLPFAHGVNKSLWFVCLLTKKQKEVIDLQTDLMD